MGQTVRGLFNQKQVKVRPRLEKPGFTAGDHLSLLTWFVPFKVLVWCRVQKLRRKHLLKGKLLSH